MPTQDEVCILFQPRSNHAYHFYHVIFKPRLAELEPKKRENAKFLTILYLLAFLKYIDSNINLKALIKYHLRDNHLQLEHYLNNLAKQKFILLKTPENKDALTNNERLANTSIQELLPKATRLIENYDFDDFLTLKREKERFKESWLEPLAKTIVVSLEVTEHSKVLRQETNKYYADIARQSSLWLGTKDFLNKRLGFLGFNIRNKTEKAFFAHPLVRKYIFEVWLENIGQPSSKGHQHERVVFLKYLRRLLRYGKQAKYADIQKNYDMTRRDLRINRVEGLAFIAFILSFQKRPYKDIFAEYFKLSIVTGGYDFLLKRLKKYNTMVQFPALGERFAFDSRIDYSPVILPLNLKYSLPIFLSKTQTRQSGIYIGISPTNDKNILQQQTNQLNALKQQLEAYSGQNTFLDSDLKNIEIGDNGKIYRKQADEHNNQNKLKKSKNQQEKRTPFKGYGKNRSNYLKDKALLTFYQASSGQQSGLVVNFNLRDPILLLLEGLDRENPLQIDELCYVLKALDLYEAEFYNLKLSTRQAEETPSDTKDNEAQKDEICPACIEEFIDNIFDPKDCVEMEEKLPEGSAKFLKKLERIRHEYFDKQADCTHAFAEESAWKYLSNRIVENQEPTLLTAIIERFSHTCFDMSLSLSALLAGQELPLEDNKTEKNRETPQTQAMLTEILGHHLQELLHDVFTKCIDISAATKDQRSEPLLAEIIVEGCLNLANDTQLQDKLVTHLKKHYELHYEFLKDTVYSHEESASSEIPEIKEIINEKNIKKYVSTKVDAGITDIIKLIKRTRGRLFSREQSNRLLCFIDPSSVEIMLGDFSYAGKELETQCNILDEVRSSKKMLADLKERAVEAKEQAEHKISQNIQVIKQHESDIQVKIKAAAAEGNYVEAMRLSLFADKETAKNIKEASDEFPDLLALYDDNAYKMIEKQKIKRDVLEMIAKNQDLLSKLDPTTIAILLDQNPDQSLDAETYKNAFEALAAALRREPYPAQAMLIQNGNKD